MKSKYTFLDLCKEVLTQSNKPMTPNEIWDFAKQIGLDEKIGSTGKTPSATIGARLYVDIRDNGEESKILPISKPLSPTLTTASPSRKPRKTNTTKFSMTKNTKSISRIRK